MLNFSAAAVSGALSRYRRIFVIGAKAFLVYPYTPVSPLPSGAELLHLAADPGLVGRDLPTRFGAVGDIGATLADLAPSLDESVYGLIVTRGHHHDEEALYHLAGSPAGYVGMIGSRRKIRLIYEDLLAKGVSPEALARVHAPLGLDIGSQTVPEIAVSIVAELIARRNLGSTEPRPRQRVQLGTATRP
jgi:xanthine/CO dehydrogenase XdhC/CoxF family maturation factor